MRETMYNSDITLLIIGTTRTSIQATLLFIYFPLVRRTIYYIYNLYVSRIAFFMDWLFFVAHKFRNMFLACIKRIDFKLTNVCRS